MVNKIEEEKARTLLGMAVGAAKKAYCPYSHFRVGAALLCKDGRVFCGFNIENSSYGATVCAERVALFGALNAGCVRGDLLALAVVGAPEGQEDFSKASPCGICRQTLSEFADGDLVLLFPKEGGVEQTLFGELFPQPFEL